MCCESNSLTSSCGSPVPVSKLKVESCDLQSPRNLICHINDDKEPPVFLASENLTDYSGPPGSPSPPLSVLQLESLSSQSDTEINSSTSQYENQMVSLLKNEIYEAFIKYKKVIGKAIQPFIRLDHARSFEDFMQEAFIPFCKGYYYCSSDKVEKSKATNLIYNCVRHYFVDQYANWSVFQEGVSNHNGNSLWKESNNLPGHCRRVNAEI